ncbi:MAG TPA: phospholipase D-like domain-containing protein, partial [Syntrophales bacterium]|nr:phospholipase D-like domain-containing protein [Syntrophales bacterium]
RALLERLADENRPKLQVVLVLPQRAHTLMEQASLANIQKKLLDSLRAAAKEGGHRLGLYSPVSGTGPSEVQVYIHSKVLVVDDRFITVGSANTTNRSMGLDTELNLSWEAAPDEGESIRSIREARLSLLAEHLGNGDIPEEGDLVEFLDRRAEAGDTRLRRHGGDVEDVARWLDELGATEIADSEKPFLDEQIYETVSRDPSGFFARGLTALNGILDNGPSGSSPGRMARFRRFLRYVFPLAALAAGLALFWLYFRGP